MLQQKKFDTDLMVRNGRIPLKEPPVIDSGVAIRFFQMSHLEMTFSDRILKTYKIPSGGDMKGKVLDFSIQTNSGIISADDGKRYIFQGSEWKSTNPPRQGIAVDFEISGENAKGIYPDIPVSGSTTASSENTKIVAAVLAFFLGAFGAHKFYLGITKPAIIMLCVSIGGFILVGIPTIAMGVIAFIEFIIYLTKSDEEFTRIYVIGKKAWF